MTTPRVPSIAAVILAAGTSERMGQDKALLPWRGDTLLAGTIEMLQPVSQLWMVVAGANFDDLAPIVYSRGGFLVQNPSPEEGQFSSLRVGLQAVLDYGRDAAVVALVDRPPAQPDTVMHLYNAFLRYPAKWLVVPEYQGRHGHPIFVGREMIEAFLRAPGTTTAREVEHALQERIEYVAVDDENVVMNLNTPEEYAAWQAR